MVDTLIIGQGLAGTTLAWFLHRAGDSVAICDRAVPGAASRVAAGLYAPISGKRMALPWGGAEMLAEAEPFYRMLEAETGASFLHAQPALRIFHESADLESWSKRREWPTLTPWVEREWTESISDFGLCPNAGGVQLRASGWLDLTTWLQTMRAWLKDASCWVDEPVDAARVICCDGHAVAEREAFLFLPLRPCKGDILRIETSDPLPPCSLHRNGIYLLPTGTNTARVGGVFHRQFDSVEPSAEDAERLRDGLAAILPLRYEVVAHEAGIRPSTTHIRPIAGMLPDQPRLGLFNSLSSKGVLFAPYVARLFSEHLLEGRALPSDIDLATYVAKYRS